MTVAAPARQADITRAVKAVRDAGMNVREILVTREGARVVIGDPVDQPKPASDARQPKDWSEWRE